MKYELCATAEGKFMLMVYEHETNLWREVAIFEHLTPALTALEALTHDR